VLQALRAQLTDNEVCGCFGGVEGAVIISHVAVQPTNPNNHQINQPPANETNPFQTTPSGRV